MTCSRTMFSSSAAHWAEKPAKFRSTVKISPHAIARRRSVLLYSVLILRIIDLFSLHIFVVTQNFI